MERIKNDREKFVLLLPFMALLAVSVYLAINTRSLVSTFEALKGPVVENNNVPPLDLHVLENAEVSVRKPASWSAHTGSLFVPRQYSLQYPSGPIKSTAIMVHPPVPNEWFIKNNLDITDPNILSEDPDGAGFTVLDAWNYGTDPLDKNSHPPYTAKLRLVRFYKVPFCAIFNARPDADSFQINMIDVNQPSQILKLGDPIAGTKFKIIKFTEKYKMGVFGVDDVSELTLQNIENGDQIVLNYGRQEDSPDSYAVFKYLWNNLNTEFTVKKNQEFTLRPETDVKYKLIDLTGKNAVIQTKTGEKIIIPHLDEGNH